MKFIDLFSGLGGFHVALRQLNHECVFASELDSELSNIYLQNFGIKPVGDIRKVNVSDIPKHEILCAGFPCQPYSKAGDQLGVQCPRWGDLFKDHVLRIINHHRPVFILLENVANLQKHNGGNTWREMNRMLARYGYDIDAKILSPHRFGIPQIRERMYIVGSLLGLKKFEWPVETNVPVSIYSVLESNPSNAKRLPHRETKCLDVWQEFLDRSPQDIELPSFPIWTTEFGADYPYQEETPYAIGLNKLKKYKGAHGFHLSSYEAQKRLDGLPSYARTSEKRFPRWKINFIKQNREFYISNKSWIDPWLPKILEFPPSWQKFEWNCKGEERNIWKFIVQFRASGVRVKRPTTAPSLIAMTLTQIPIIAWEKRYMTPRECLRIQNLDTLRNLPISPTKTYRALGNAVNSEIVKLIAKSLIGKINHNDKIQDSMKNTA